MLSPVGDASRVPWEGKPLPYEILLLSTTTKSHNLKRETGNLEQRKPAFALETGNGKLETVVPLYRLLYRLVFYNHSGKGNKTKIVLI